MHIKKCTFTRNKILIKTGKSHEKLWLKNVNIQYTFYGAMDVKGLFFWLALFVVLKGLSLPTFAKGPTLCPNQFKIILYNWCNKNLILNICYYFFSAPLLYKRMLQKTPGKNLHKFSLVNLIPGLRMKPVGTKTKIKRSNLKSAQINLICHSNVLYCFRQTNIYKPKYFSVLFGSPI